MAERRSPQLMPSLPATQVSSKRLCHSRIGQEEVKVKVKKGAKYDAPSNPREHSPRLTPSRVQPAEPKVNNELALRRKRDVCQDMEALRLSRQDNPYLQNLASRESILDVDEGDTEDSVLVSKGYVAGNVTETLSLFEVHEHMIRSPPPSVLPHRSQSFQFPSQTQAQSYATPSCCQSQVKLHLQNYE